MALLANGSGAVCKEAGGKGRVRTVTTSGIGFAGGLQPGVVMLKYTDFDVDSQDYSGRTWGIYLFAGLEGVSGKSDEYGSMSMFGVGLNTGLPLEYSGVDIRISKVGS